MIEQASQLLAVIGYLPHGYCIGWSGPLLTAYVASDILIFLAYFSIPLALIYFARRRTDFPHKWLLWMFAAFILSCGLTHLLDVIVLWQPIYGLQAMLNAVTAVISVITAIMLWPLIPQVLRIPNAESFNEAQRMAKMGNWTLDLVSGKLIWSDEVFRIFEIDPTRFEATYAAFLNAIHPDDREAVDQAYTNSLLTRVPYEITHRLRMSDGRIKWVIERCKSDFDAAGKPLRSVGTVQDITEYKLSEMALGDAHDLLNTIINTAPIRVFWKDNDLRFMGCNSSFAKDAGKTQVSELIGKDDYQMAWAEQADHYRSDDKSVMESGIPKLCYEEPQTTPDGKTIWLRTSKVPLRNRDNEIVGILGIYEDISQQVAAREELRVRKEFFQRTFNDAAVGMAIADLNGRYLCANAAMCRMVGYTEDELKRMTYRDITHPDDVAENDRQRELLVHNELDTFEMEKRYVRKDGRVVWAIMVVSVIKGPDGKAMVSVGQMLDIDQLKRTQAELQVSEANLRTMMDNSPIQTWLKDTEGRYITINKVYADYLRLDAPEQATGKTDMDLHPKELAEKYRADDAEVMASRQQKHVEESAFDGHRMHWVETFKTPITDAQGRVLGTVGFARDISERKRHEREMIRSREQLRALAAYHERILEEERKHIAREIHDELGQQLSALKLDIGLLRRNHADIPDIVTLAQQMRETVDKSIDVVRQVASNLRPAALDLGIVAAIEWLTGEFTNRWGIDCEIDSNGDDIVLAEAQATVVFRVVQESLTNVARHSDARHVSIVLRHRNCEFSLCIHDDGCGFNVDSDATKSGFGLIGMRERVLSLDGTLVFDSQPGMGTTVVITFPLSQT